MREMNTRALKKNPVGRMSPQQAGRNLAPQGRFNSHAKDVCGRAGRQVQKAQKSCLRPRLAQPLKGALTTDMHPSIQGTSALAVPEVSGWLHRLAAVCGRAGPIEKTPFPFEDCRCDSRVNRAWGNVCVRFLPMNFRPDGARRRVGLARRCGRRRKFGCRRSRRQRRLTFTLRRRCDGCGGLRGRSCYFWLHFC